MRYLAATAMGGRLFVQGVNDPGSWDAARLVYWDAAAVDKVYHPLAGDRKVETAEELLEVLRVSERGLPAIKVWIREDLQTLARRVWSRSSSLCELS